jgi:hypothetical protein
MGELKTGKFESEDDREYKALKTAIVGAMRRRASPLDQPVITMAIENLERRYKDDKPIHRLRALVLMLQHGLVHDSWPWTR